MNSYVLKFLFLIIYVNISFANDELLRAVESVDVLNEKIAQVGNVARSKCQEEELDKNIEKNYLKDYRKRELELSGISMEYAEYLFSKLANASHIPFQYPQDGCYARAHAMARMLDEEGVKSGKVFVEGDLQVKTQNSPRGFVRWWYHVAPVVTVKTGRKITERVEVTGSRIKRKITYDEYVPMVMDPSIFDRPVPIKEWIDIQTKHIGARVDKSYYTRRFNFGPGSKSRRLTSYSEKDLEQTNLILEKYSDYVRAAQ